MACSTCVCEWLLGILNVLLMLVGLAIAAIGAILLAASSSSFLSGLEDTIKKILSSLSVVGDDNFVANLDFQAVFGSAAIILIVVGLAIACIAFIGWCSNCCGGYNIMRIVYAIILGVLLLAQIIVAALFFSKVFNDEIKKQVTNLINTKYVSIDDSTLTSIGMNIIMIEFQCCGLNNYTDFYTAEKWERNKTLIIEGTKQSVNLTTPVACCATTGSFPDVDVLDDLCAVHPNDTISNWKKGCWDEVSDKLIEYRTDAILIVSAIFVVQAVILVIVIIIIKADQSKVTPI